MKKRFLIGLSIIMIGLMVTGCSVVDEEDNFKDHNKYNNAIECSKQISTGQEKYLIYFYEDDTVSSFDYYNYRTYENMTSDQLEVIKAEFCDDNEMFQQEWIANCDYSRVNDDVKVHLYLRNGKYFGESKTKEEIKDILMDEYSGFQCVDR